MTHTLPLWKALTPEACDKILKGNYARLFDVPAPASGPGISSARALTPRSAHGSGCWAQAGSGSAWLSAAAQAQQFNSDSWIAKQHGTATIIVTRRPANDDDDDDAVALPRWEFTVAAYIYNRDADRLTSEGHSTSAYAKFMFWQNDAETGGGAVKAGVGMNPSYILEGVAYKTGSQTFWTNAPITLPFFDNRLSWTSCRAPARP